MKLQLVINTTFISICCSLFASGQAIADPAKAKTPSPKTFYEAQVENYQGFPSESFTAPFLVRFFVTKPKEPKFKLVRDSAAQWLFPPLSQCSGHIVIPEKVNENSWAIGVKGTFDILCPDGFSADGELVVTEVPSSGDFQSAWQGVGRKTAPPIPMTDEEFKAGVKIKEGPAGNIKFTLKIK